MTLGRLARRSAASVRQPRRARLRPLAQLGLCGPPLSFLGDQRTFHASSSRRDNIPSWPAPPVPQPSVTPSDPPPPSSSSQNSSGSGSSSQSGSKTQSWFSQWTSSASFQAALTTVVGLGMVFGAGVGYLEWYKSHVLHRIERAFAPGYDPALELSTLHAPNAAHIKRVEQELIDRIVRGDEQGGYYLIIGPKGSGKGTMVLDAMKKINAEGASFCEAHPDLEVFRLRLGKALDFDFYEDWQGSLFSRADPRNGGPALDVERAMNKLEKVALRYAKKHGRPLVLAFNNVHLFPNTPEGHGLLHQLQQRAEAWAEGGILTMILSTDDFWCLDVLRKNASRMRILSVYDLPAAESIRALRSLRLQNLAFQYPGVSPNEVPVEDDKILREVYERIGGRTSYLGRVARAPDMLEEARHMVEMDKQWLLSKRVPIGLIPEMDDDVMDEQKWASCSWLLLRHLAKMANAAIAETPDDTVDMQSIGEDLVLPKVTFEEARKIMTRTDFLEPLDHAHIISIDVHHHVRPDSVLLLRAAQEVIAEEGFDDALDQTRDRIDEIEGLHRQSELTVKEPFRVMVDKNAGRTVIDVIGLGGSFVPAEEEEEGEDVKRLV